MARHTLQDLQELQALPLSLKIRLTQQRIREWIDRFGVDGVYVSFSGGKDSTVLLDIAKNNGYTMREAIDWMAEHGDIVVKY